MENIELINIWKQQNDKIEKTLAINEMLLRELTNKKVESSLNALKKLKALGIISFIIYIFLIGYALFYAISHYSSAWNYFIVSFAAIFLINIKGLADYIKHLIWTNRINYNGSILDIQQQLAQLQLSIIHHAKTMCLQFPFFTTFYLSDIWFPSKVSGLYVFCHILFTGTFVFLSYWLYRNHKVENLNKKWFRMLIAGSGGKSVMEAMNFYQEMEDFKRE